MLLIRTGASILLWNLLVNGPSERDPKPGKLNLGGSHHAGKFWQAGLSEPSHQQCPLSVDMRLGAVSPGGSFVPEPGVIMKPLSRPVWG